MAILETVMKMKQQGVSEGQIVQTLRQQGVSPREINEALSQSKIKSAIGAQDQMASEGYSGTYQEGQNYSEQQGAPEEYAPEGYAEPGQAPEQYQEYAPQESQGYAPAGEYQQATQSADIETMNDIAEQIVEEKTSKLKKEIAEFTKFREEMKSDFEKINQRLAKIENVFNELQVAILKKIGEYGENIKNISEEMHATQDSFSKMINPITDNIRKSQKIKNESPVNTEEKPEAKPKKEIKTEQPQAKNQKNNFEDYLR